jgi:hypothetical protein
VNNQVRGLGSRRLGWPCLLTGSGMAFPWSIIRGAELATGHLAEDLLLTVDLVRAGASPLFCPEARVSSEFASGDGLRAQRTRWEHGHLALLVNEVPALLLQAFTRRDAKLAALALDLCSPPLRCARRCLCPPAQRCRRCCLAQPCCSPGHVTRATSRSRASRPRRSMRWGKSRSICVSW